MTTTNFFKIAFSLAIFLTACQKEEDIKPLPETDYPTVYGELTQAEWKTRFTEFEKINNPYNLTLDKLGFAAGEIHLNDSNLFSKEFILFTVDSIVNTYRDFLGIEKVKTFNLNYDLLIDDPFLIPNGQISIEYLFDDSRKEMFEEYRKYYYPQFRVQLRQQKINENYFSGSNLYFEFNIAEKTLLITGHWFPEASIPKTEIYTSKEAAIIAWREIKHLTGEDTRETIFDEVPYKMLICHFIDDKIEIRQCWVLTLWNLQYRLYIDTQTGEMLRFEKYSMYM